MFALLQQNRSEQPDIANICLGKNIVYVFCSVMSPIAGCTILVLKWDKVMADTVKQISSLLRHATSWTISQVTNSHMHNDILPLSRCVLLWCTGCAN